MSLESSHLIVFIVALLLAACVFTLNPITIIAIVRTRSLRRDHSNIFLINLALIDLLLMLLVIVFTSHLMARDASGTACVVGLVYFGTIATASMLSSFAIAVDRFLFIHNALQYPVIVTHARVMTAVLVIWLASFLMGTVPLFDGEIAEDNSCQHPRNKALNIQDCLIVSLFFVAGIVSVCLYAKLFFIIRQHNHVLETHARAHCLHHDCQKQACRLKTRLGECRFRSSSSTTSFSLKPEERVNGTNRDDDSAPCAASDSLTISPSSEEVTQDTTRSFSFGDDPISTSSEDSCAHSSTQGATQSTKEWTCTDKSSNHKNEANQTDLDSGPLAKTSQKHGNCENSELAGTTHNTLTCTIKRKRSKVRFRKCQHLRDLRTIKTLMLMFAIYFICWAPLVCMRIMTHLRNMEVNHDLFYSASIIAISNSLWNFLVYPLRKKELRLAIFRLLSRCVGYSSNRQQKVQYYMCQTQKQINRKM